MRNPGTTAYRLIDWILVLALALAPFQSAWSAFDSRCQHEQDRQKTAQPHNPALQANATPAPQDLSCSRHKEQTSSVSDSSSTAGNCCCKTQDNGSGHCAGNCQPVPAALYLPPLKLVFSLGFFTTFVTQQPVFNNGRTVPPPYQPPRG